MSSFFSEKYKSLVPYTPGEQPRDMQYIKLNTNESPFAPPPSVSAAVSEAAGILQLYPDPDCRELTALLAERYGVRPDEIVLGNGSDEILNFAFMAYCDNRHPALFPDITYGFYSVFAEINGVPYKELPLRDDFTIDVDGYLNCGHTVFIANPNAPTGIALTLSQIEQIVQSNPDNVVVIDEAYIDFGGESAVPLIHKYNNLLVVQTFSKSRSMAGARLGFGIGSPSLISDLHTIRYSTNPYNINRMTAAAGIATLKDDAYTAKCCRAVMDNRAYTVEQLERLGFSTLPSSANFVFATHPLIDGGELYAKLKARGVLVRHFNKQQISQYNRITIGSREQMEKFISTVGDILEEYK